MSPPTLTRNQAKHIRGLRDRKYRYQHQQFVAEGETIVAEILAAAPAALRYIVCTSEYYLRQSDSLQAQLTGSVFCCDLDTFRRISSLDSPPAALAVLDMPAAGLPATGLLDPQVFSPAPTSPASSPPAGLQLYLDGIRDPGNLGTILRVADWFGHAAVYLSEDCVDVYNSKTVQASMGAFLRVRAHTSSLSQLQLNYPQLAIVGTRIESGHDGLAYAWPRDSLLVIGSESHGIRPEQQSLINTWISIPRGREGSGAESLNAAVASGILCAAYLASRRCHPREPNTLA